MKVTASKLRENIYRILDQVLQTGTPVEIKRKGRTLKIVSEDAPKKTSRLIRRNIIHGRAEDLIHLDWSNEWKPE
jgi:PHD/YefM family antitoxin component YafN of YafNO toxin-antitoxin module